MSETIEELKAALASEKSARLKAEAEHDKWCKVADEALTRARTAEADVEQARKELRAWAANGDYTINLGIATATERLQKERDEARAACAEMRNALEHPDEVCTRLRALSTSSGTGWLSPEKARMAIEALQRSAELLSEVSKCCSDLRDWDTVDGDCVNTTYNTVHEALTALKEEK